MRFLFLKLLRDIRHSVGQYVAIAVVIILGVAAYAGMMSASASLKQNVDQFYAEQNLADLWVTVPGAGPSMIAAVRALPGVQAADGRVALTGTAGANSFTVHAIPSDPTVNIPLVERGSLPQSANECIVDRGYADVNRLQVGDTITVSIGGASHDLTVSGVFNSPEYLYLTKDITTQPDHKTYGALMITQALIPDQPDNEIVVKLTPGADVNELKSQIANIAMPSGGGVILDRTQLLSWVQMNNDVTQFGQIGSVFPIIFFLVAAAIIFISVSKNVEIQRDQIGNMKALGISRSAITFHYLSYTLLICAVGAILGAVLGIVLVMPAIQGIITSYYTMPAMHPVAFAANVLVAAVLAFVFGIAATLVSVQKPLSESPAMAMRPKAPGHVNAIWLEHNEKLWSRLSFGRKIVLRNLFLHKGRALLSSIGIIGCVGLLLASFGFLDSLGNVLGNQYFRMNQYDIAVTLNTPVTAGSTFPVENQRIAASWGQGSLPASINGAAGTTATKLMAMDADSDAIALYTPAGKLVSLPGDGVILPQLLADKYNLHVGDSLPLTLTPIGGSPQTVTVRVGAIAVEYLEQDVYISFDYLAQLGVSIPVATFFLKVDASADVNNVAAAIGRDPAVRQALTNAQMAQAWTQELGVLNSLVIIMIAISAALALAVVYNISAINIVERRRDIATLRVLGYHRAEVNRLIFQENLLITGFGALLGLPVGVGMLKLILDAVVSDTMTVPITVSPLSVLYSIALGFGFTVVANQLLRGKIKRIDMVESLKSVE